MPPGDRRILAAHPNAPDSGLSCGYRKLSPSWKRENLVCMPTLSAGETDRGNRSVAIQRRSESQSGVQRTIRCQLATRLLWFIRRTEAIVAEDRLTLSGVALVSVMESSKLRNRDDAPAFWLLHYSRLRSVLGQCQMGSGALVVGKIIFQSPAQRCFIPHDDVV